MDILIPLWVYDSHPCNGEPYDYSSYNSGDMGMATIEIILSKKYSL